MKYKGYRGMIVYDEEDRSFFGRVIGIRDVITFQGKTVDELEQALIDSMDEYFDWCAELGQKPEKPCSGNLRLRMNPELHAGLVLEAASEGISLNSLINKKLTG